MRQKKAVVSKQDNFSNTLNRSYIVFTLDTTRKNSNQQQRLPCLYFCLLFQELYPVKGLKFYNLFKIESLSSQKGLFVGSSLFTLPLCKQKIHTFDTHSRMITEAKLIGKNPHWEKRPEFMKIMKRYNPAPGHY